MPVHACYPKNTCTARAEAGWTEPGIAHEPTACNEEPATQSSCLLAVLDVSLTLLPRRQQQRVSSAQLGGMAKAVLSAFESLKLRQQRPHLLTLHVSFKPERRQIRQALCMPPQVSQWK